MKKSDIFLLVVIILIYIVVLSGLVQTASVEGVSMYPIFQNGYLTFYTSPKNINVGDIIIYKSPTFNTYVIHHVVRIDEINGQTYYVTQGVDHITNPQPDNKIGLEGPYGIAQSQVIGKVAEVNGVVISIPYLGYISILFSLF